MFDLNFQDEYCHQLSAVDYKELKKGFVWKEISAFNIVVKGSITFIPLLGKKLSCIISSMVHKALSYNE